MEVVGKVMERMLEAFKLTLGSIPRALTPAKPQPRKDNAVFLSLMIKSVAKIHFLLSDSYGDFHIAMKGLYENAQGVQIDTAVQATLVHIEKNYRRTHSAVYSLASETMGEARSASGDDSIANDERMAKLRDHWLYALEQAPSTSASEIGEGFVTLPIYVATNQDVLPKAAADGIAWGTKRGKEVTFGEVRLSLPNVFNYTGNKGGTWEYAATRKSTTRSEIVQVSAKKIEEQAWTDLLKSRVTANAGKEACVFVHGYNTTLSSACQSAAQIVYTGNFHIPGIVFSWPSAGNYEGYMTDEATVMWAVEDFLGTLRKFKKDLGIEKLHFVAHSMGNRLVLYSLLRLFPSADYPKVVRVNLAAPDFDTGEFMKIYPAVLSHCEHISLYCSEEDLALDSSQALHGDYPRLGDFGGFRSIADEVQAIPNFDVINTTGLDTSLAGHGYVFTVSPITLDCCMNLLLELPPEERLNLQPVTLNDAFKYWRFTVTSSNPVALYEVVHLLKVKCEEHQRSAMAVFDINLLERGGC